MRYRLRTLLILMAVLPPLLWFGWTKYAAWKAEQERQRALREGWIFDVAFPIYVNDAPAFYREGAELEAQNTSKATVP